MRKSIGIAVIAAMGMAGAAFAQAEYDGDTCGEPTWNRPFADFSGLSGVGTDVPYQVAGMTVDADGLYTIDSLQDGWDGFLFLYEISFDPLDQLTNGVAGDDDGPGGIGTSQILDVQLFAGTQYFVVMTGFDNDDCGPYTNSAFGAGNVTFEPPASCLALAVEDLVAGGTATFTVDGGTPGVRGAVLWGTGGPPTVVEDLDGWCANFDFEVQLKGRRVRLAASGIFDGDGSFSSERNISEGLSGLEVSFQAAEQGTCPGVCMSNVVDAVVE